MEAFRSFLSIASCEMRRDGPSGIGRHRAAEIVASQGASTPPPVADPYGSALKDYSRSNISRQLVGSGQWSTGSFVGSPPSFPMVGYPYTGRQYQQNVPINDSFSGHLPCTAAALAGSQDGAAPGRGLNVVMQRGMGKAQSLQETSESLPLRPAKIRSESPGRMMTAARYRAADEDDIDEALADACTRLPDACAKALNIRRIAPGEYEVDGAPVRLSWQQEYINNTMQVVVHRLGEEEEPDEALSRYLRRAGNEALKKNPLDMELPSFPWPFGDVLGGTMRKVAGPPVVARPVRPGLPPAPMCSSRHPPPRPQAPPPAFVIQPRNAVQRSPSLVVPARLAEAMQAQGFPGHHASHQVPIPHKKPRQQMPAWEF